MPNETEKQETVEKIENEQSTTELMELVPMNEVERNLVQLHDGDITSEEFLATVFNGPLFVLTSEDQVDHKNRKLKDRPKLFTLFGQKEQPFLALFTDRSRAASVQKKHEEFTVVLQVPVGDLLAGSGGVGIVVNPFWDKHARWEPEQINMFGATMKREENGLWVKLPKEELITVMTPQGNPIQVGREQFKNNILPVQIKQYGDNPEALFNVIMAAVNQGFASEVLGAAEKLVETDPIKERSTTALGTVLMRIGNVDDAQVLFESFLKEDRTAMILSHLAKVYDLKGDKEKRFELLEEALNKDPNLESALEWYCSIINDEKGGQEAIVKALDELEGLAGSWRPALLLGRAKIMDGAVDEAVEHYTDAMEVDGHAPEALVQATSELGRMEHHEKVIEFGVEHYDIRKDDPRAGFNVLQACLITQNKDKGLELCKVMEEIPFPEVQATVKKYRDELEKIS